MRNNWLFVLFILPFALAAEAQTGSEGDLLISYNPAGLSLEFIDVLDADLNLLETINTDRDSFPNTTYEPQDLVLDSKGRIQHFVFSGSSGYLSTLGPKTKEWTHQTANGWDATSGGSQGGLTRVGHRIVAVDHPFKSDEVGGLVVYDTVTNEFSFPIQSRDFQPNDVTLGLDGFVWAVEGVTAYKYHPTSFELLDTVSLENTVTGGIRNTIAVDENGDLYIGNLANSISRIDADGQLVDFMMTPGTVFDIDIAFDGRLVFGTGSSGTYLTNLDLQGLTKINDHWGNHVTFIQDIAFVPEPSGFLLVGSASLILLRRKNKA